MNEAVRGRARREVVGGALVIAAFVLVFLARPIAHLRDAYFSPADIGQVHSLTCVTAGHRPANELLSDPFVQFEPWTMLARDEIRAGRWPLWNPWNGNGVPLLANFQSAVLSIFSVPFYVLPMRVALVVAAFSKLFALGFFTFLFLRELKLVFLAAVLGGVVFAFAAHNVLFLQFPHSSTAALIPAALFVLERIARRFEASVRTRQSMGAPWRAQFPALLAALALVLVLGQLAGHPETLYFAAVLVAIYAAVRGIGLWRDLATIERARRRLVFLGAQLALAALAALAIGSVQTLPFFEYLTNSAALAERSHVQRPLGLFTWPVQVFPNLLGNPSNRYYLESTLPRPDFMMATLVYVGVLTLFAAVAAFAFVRRRRAIAFFAAAWVMWFVYAYNVLGSEAIFSRLPTLALAPINRSQVIPAFCVACLAAFTLHHVLDSKRARSLAVALSIVAAAAVVFWVAREHALAVVERTRGYLTDQAKRISLDANAPRHIAAIGWTLAAGVVCIAGAWLAPAGRMRGALAGGIIVIAFLQCGFLFRNFTPATSDEHFFPITPSIVELKEILRDRTVLIQGDDTLPPDSNIVYGIRQIASYDALGIDRYERLYHACFGKGGNWELVNRGSVKALQIFGVEALLERDDWIAIDSAFAFAAESPKALFSTGEIVPSADIVQDFTGIRDGLDSIRLRFARPKSELECTVDVSLEDWETGATIRTAQFRPSDMKGAKENALSATLRFDPIADSSARILRLRIRSSDASPGRALELWMRQDWRDWVNQAIARAKNLPFDPKIIDPDVEHWWLARADMRLDGELYLDLGFAAHAFTDEKNIGPFALHGLVNAAPRFRTVRRATNAHDANESWDRVLDPSFDPVGEVVIESVGKIASVSERDSTPAATPKVEVLAEDAGRISLRVPAASGSWLVLSQPWYRGWRASVDGVDAPIERANYAFGALRLPSSPCDVVLEYDPPVFRCACWLALASGIAFCAWTWLSARSSSLSAAV